VRLLIWGGLSCRQQADCGGGTLEWRFTASLGIVYNETHQAGALFLISGSFGRSMCAARACCLVGLWIGCESHHVRNSQRDRETPRQARGQAIRGCLECSSSRSCKRFLLHGNQASSAPPITNDFVFAPPRNTGIFHVTDRSRRASAS